MPHWSRPVRSARRRIPPAGEFRLTASMSLNSTTSVNWVKSFALTEQTGAHGRWRFWVCLHPDQRYIVNRAVIVFSLNTSSFASCDRTRPTQREAVCIRGGGRQLPIRQPNRSANAACFG